MAKTAYVYPQPTLKPVATPVAAPASNDSAQPASRPATDSVTAAKYLLGARISHFVRTDPALAGDWLALVALCQATRPASQGAQGAQVILSMAVDDSGASDVLGMDETDGGAEDPTPTWVTWDAGAPSVTQNGGGGESSSGLPWYQTALNNLSNLYLHFQIAPVVDGHMTGTRSESTTNPDGGVTTTVTTTFSATVGGNPTSFDIGTGPQDRRGGGRDQRDGG